MVHLVAGNNRILGERQVTPLLVNTLLERLTRQKRKPDALKSIHESCLDSCGVFIDRRSEELYEQCIFQLTSDYGVLQASVEVLKFLSEDCLEDGVSNV
jgi:hypothetical protein